MQHLRDLKLETSLFVAILVFMSSWNFLLSWVEHEFFYNLRAWSLHYLLRQKQFSEKEIQSYLEIILEDFENTSPSSNP